MKGKISNLSVGDINAALKYTQALALSNSGGSGGESIDLPISATDVTETSTLKWFTATEKSKLAGIAANATANTGDVTLAGDQTFIGNKVFNGVTAFSGVSIFGNNIQFSIDSPVLTANSFIQVPNGMYIATGNLYTGAPINARGGIQNDVGTLKLIGIVNYADDAAADAAGLTSNMVYRVGRNLRIVP